MHARAYGRRNLSSTKGELDMTDPRHLMLVGTGPGLRAAGAMD
jgi:hypothetical protein